MKVKILTRICLQAWKKMIEGWRLPWQQIQLCHPTTFCQSVGLETTRRSNKLSNLLKNYSKLPAKQFTTSLHFLRVLLTARIWPCYDLSARLWRVKLVSKIHLSSNLYIRLQKLVAWMNFGKPIRGTQYVRNSLCRVRVSKLPPFLSLAQLVHSRKCWWLSFP